MTEIKNTRVYGLEEAIKRSGYPMRWKEPDEYGYWGVGNKFSATESQEAVWKESINLTDEDWKRVKNLCRAELNSGHSNFLSGITVHYDIKMPLYLLKQWQRYHFHQIVSSQSTMHTITKRGDVSNFVNKYVDEEIIVLINHYIDLYNKEPTNEKDNYYYFMKIVSNLPSGFELWQGVVSNYLQIATIYNQRKNHKLKEDWGYFCQWAEELPFFKELVLGK